SVGLPAFVLIKVLSAGFFSRQDTKTPVKIGVIAMFTNLVLNLLLVGPLAHTGLALATSLSACLQAIILYWVLKRNRVYILKSGWMSFLFKIMAGITLMGLLVFIGAGESVVWYQWSVFQRVSNLCLWVFAGMAVYFIVLMILGLRLKEMTAPVQSV
ncbi:MAG: polysaccharide biosynthesis C-terminal domain-containing protein, partial [Proteobacteria bacterium]|nr:polysaccharide biosynthesis C-terminal domain-containing protein [Pseudomonadota bacterium]